MKCYLCGATQFSKRSGLVRDNGNLKIIECSDCGLVFLDAQDHIISGHYESSGMFGDDKPSIESMLKQSSVDDRRRFKSLGESIINKRILDFGCGNAGFLNLAKTAAKCVEGVELEARVRDFWGDKLVIHDSLGSIKSEKFDLITSFHVLEHLKDPRQALKEMGKHINKNGRIVIEVPSSSDALLTLYECKAFQEFTYWSQHLFLFNATNLRMLASQAGLKVTAVKYHQRYPLSNHLYWLSKGEPGGHKKWNFLNSLSLDDAYSSALASLGLSDTLIAYLEH